MRPFIKKLAFFLVPVLILLYPLDLLLSYGLKKSNSEFAAAEYAVWNDIYEGSVNSDIVIYGSSRAWVHFDPAIIREQTGRSTYNLGIDGHNFHMQYFRHLELLKYNRKPQLIILSVDIFTVSHRPDLYNSEQFLPFMFMNQDIREHAESYRGFTTLDYYVPLVRYTGEFGAISESIKNLAGKNSNPFRIRGYRGRNLSWNRDLEKAKEQMKSYRIETDTASIRLFEKFISELQKDSIQLVMVYAPEFFEGQEFVSNREEVIAYFDSIALKARVPFINYSDDPISYRRDLFYNSLHLNKTGAEVFTRKFTADLLKLVQ